MGTDKAFLEWNGVPLIARVLARVRELADDVLISANDAARFAAFDARVVPDAVEGAGPLAGLCAGLEAAAHEVTLLVACDMPLLNMELMKYMLGFAPAYDAVIPQMASAELRAPEQNARAPRAKDLALHPLHAVYTKQCIVPIRDALARGERRMIAFHAAVRVRVITQEEILQYDPSGYALWNVNTPDKWEALQKLK